MTRVRSRVSRIVCLIPALALAGGPQIGLAAEPPEGEPADAGDEATGEEGEKPAGVSEAEQAYKKGSQAYAVLNYEEAVKHFERSFELSGRPELLFNIGRAYAGWYDVGNDINHLRKALKMFRNYSAFLKQRADSDAEEVQSADDEIAGLEAKLEAHEEREREAAERERKAKLAAGQPDPAQSPEEDDSGLSRKAALGFMIGGGVAAGAGAVLLGVMGYGLGQGQQAEDDGDKLRQDMPPSGAGPRPAELDSIIDDGRAANRLAVGTGIAGGLLLAVGTGLLVYGILRRPKTSANTAKIRLEPAVTGLKLRF